MTPLYPIKSPHPITRALHVAENWTLHAVDRMSDGLERLLQRLRREKKRA